MRFQASRCMVDMAWVGAFLVLGAAPSFAEPNRWTPELEAGPIHLVEFDPADPSRLIAAGSGSIYESLDGGSHWQEMVAVEPLIQALRFAPSDSETIYGATEDTLWRSQDGGATWRQFAIESDQARISTVNFLIDPSNADRVYWFGLTNRFGRSEDGGETWTFRTLDPGDLHFVNSLAIGPRGILYAIGQEQGGESFVLSSYDSGRSWLPWGGFLGSGLIEEFEVDSEGLTFYATQNGRVRRSTNEGISWSDVTPQTRWKSFHLKVAPSQGSPDVLYAYVNVLEELGGLPFGVTFFRSDDQGETWTTFEIEAVQFGGLAIDPQDSDHLVGASFHGAHLSHDGGRTWRRQGGGLGYGLAEQLAVSADGTLFAAQERGLFRRAAPQGEWELLRVDRYARVAVHPDRSLMATVSRFGFEISQDSGQTFERFRLVRDFIPADMLIGPGLPATIFIGGTDGAVYLYSEDGQAPTSIDLGGRVHRLSIDPHDGRHVFAATSGNLLHSFDDGLSWEPVPGPASGKQAFDLAASPVRPGHWFLATEDGLFKTLDAGASWLEVPSPADDGNGESSLVRELSFDPRRPTHLYASNGAGLFRSVDEGGSWVGLGIPSDTLAFAPDGVTVYSAAFDSDTTDTISEPAGIWSIDLRPELYLGAPDDAGRGRFDVSVTWQDYDDRKGVGLVASLDAGSEAGQGEEVVLQSTDSGALGFFAETNWEVLVKVLDGRAVNNRFWIFSAAATDVGYSLEVVDTACGRSRTFVNPVGRPSPAMMDLDAFHECYKPTPSCVADEETLCLGDDGRYQVRMTWSDGEGGNGQGRRVRLSEPGWIESADSGLFYFFQRDNWELLVKVIDGCAINGKVWVFSAGTTDVEYTLRVEDRETGEVRTYENALGSAAAALTDTEAFRACG